MIAQVIDVNKILEQALLFDFYGELLTEHQKEIYGQFIQEDLSLGEIAKEAGSAGRAFMTWYGAAARRLRAMKRSCIW